MKILDSGNQVDLSFEAICSEKSCQVKLLVNRNDLFKNPYERVNIVLFKCIMCNKLTEINLDRIISNLYYGLPFRDEWEKNQKD